MSDKRVKVTVTRENYTDLLKPRRPARRDKRWRRRNAKLAAEAGDPPVAIGAETGYGEGQRLVVIGIDLARDEEQGGKG